MYACTFSMNGLKELEDKTPPPPLFYILHSTAFLCAPVFICIPEKQKQTPLYPRRRLVGWSLGWRTERTTEDEFRLEEDDLQVAPTTDLKVLVQS